MSPFLIFPEILRNTIHHIQLILNNGYNNFHLTQTNPDFYYSNAIFIDARNHSTIFLLIKFPISTFSEPRTLYKIISLPVPINELSNHSTQFLDTDDYFLQIYDNQHYAMLTRQTVKGCIGTKLSVTLTSSAYYLYFTSRKVKYINCMCDLDLS